MKEESRYASLSAGIFLVGLGLLFLLPGVGIWPWILAVIGLAGLPAALATKRGWLGYQSAFWMIGLALLFWSGFFWPGILIMVGLSVLLGGLYRGAQRSTSESPEPLMGGTASRDAESDPFDVDKPLFPEDERERGSGGDTRQL